MKRPACWTLVRRIAGLDAVAQVWLMQVDAAGTGVQTKEKALHSSVEGAFDGVLVIEALHTAAAQAALDRLLHNGLATGAWPTGRSSAPASSSTGGSPVWRDGSRTPLRHRRWRLNS